jgi:hypothetical protein
MKYFAHYCAADDDPKIVKLFEAHGYNGTGIYWRLCAIVAGMKKGAGDTPEYLCVPRTLSLHRRCSAPQVRLIVSTLTQLGLIESKEEGDNFIIKIPKLNNYMDENAKRNERERSPRRPDIVRPYQTIEDHTREEKKDLTAASSASALGAEPTPPEVKPEELGSEDPQARAETLKFIKAMSEKLGNADKLRPVSTPVEKSSESERPGQPQTVDPQLEQELVLTRADIVDHGIDPARANQIITLLAEYHSGRMEAHQLSRALDGVVTCHEKVCLYEVDGVIDRRTT